MMMQQNRKWLRSAFNAHLSMDKAIDETPTVLRAEADRSQRPAKHSSLAAAVASSPPPALE